MGECRDLKSSIVKNVVIGIRLGQSTLENRDELAAKALESVKVQKAIQDAFRKQAETLLGSKLSGQPLSGSAAMALLAPIVKVAQPEILKHVKKQKAYGDASAGLKDLQCAFDETPVGAFIDDNKNLLIIIGVLTAVGGAVAFYRFQTGDIPAKGLAAITNLVADKIEIGDVTFGLKGLDFQPSKRNVSGTANFSMGKAKSINTTFVVKTAIKAGSLETLTVGEKVIVPLNDRTKMSAKASVGLTENKPTYDMALTVKYGDKGFAVDLTAYTKGIGTEQSIGTRGKAAYDIDSSRFLGQRSRTRVEATVGVAAPLGGRSGSVQVGLGVTVDF